MPSVCVCVFVYLSVITFINIVCLCSGVCVPIAWPVLLYSIWSQIGWGLGDCLIL